MSDHAGKRRARRRRLRLHRRGDRAAARAPAASRSSSPGATRRRPSARARSSAPTGATAQRAGVRRAVHGVDPRRRSSSPPSATACPTSSINSLGVQNEQPLLEVTEEAFDEILDVNLKAAMFLGAGGRAAADRRGARRPPRAPALGAGAARPARPRPLGLLREQGRARAAGQAARDRARASTASTSTASRRPWCARRSPASWLTDPEIHRQLIERIPLGRIAEVDDVVGPTLFFCSDASAFVTGQILYVDGGVTASQ